MLTHVVRARRAILQSCAAIALVSCGADLGTAPAETSPGASQQEATFHPTANLTLAGGNYRWTDASFASATSMAIEARTAGDRRSTASANRGDTGVPCLLVTGTFVASPAKAANGLDRDIATNGEDAKPWTAACNGDMNVVGEF